MTYYPSLSEIPSYKYNYTEKKKDASKDKWKLDLSFDEVVVQREHQNEGNSLKKSIINKIKYRKIPVEYTH